MENNMIISKEEYAELVRKELRLELIINILKNKEIKYSGDIVSYIKFMLNIEKGEDNG